MGILTKFIETAQKGLLDDFENQLWNKISLSYLVEEVREVLSYDYLQSSDNLYRGFAK